MLPRRHAPTVLPAQALGGTQDTMYRRRAPDVSDFQPVPGLPASVFLYCRCPFDFIIFDFKDGSSMSNWCYVSSLMGTFRFILNAYRFIVQLRYEARLLFDSASIALRTICFENISLPLLHSLDGICKLLIDAEICYFHDEAYQPISSTKWPIRHYWL